MNMDSVSEAFKLLLEEIQGVINILKDKSRSTLDISNYHQAREYIEKAESMEKFKEKVMALQKEWENSHASRLLKEESWEVKMEKTEYTRRRAKYTQPEEYTIPILESLVEMGGSGRAEEVLKKVEEKMKGRLTERDYERIPSGDIRWRKYAHWRRLHLVKGGLLSNSSPRGIWEITEKGRKYLEEVK